MFQFSYKPDSSGNIMLAEGTSISDQSFCEIVVKALHSEYKGQSAEPLPTLKRGTEVIRFTYMLGTKAVVYTRADGNEFVLQKDKPGLGQLKEDLVHDCRQRFAAALKSVRGALSYK